MKEPREIRGSEYYVVSTDFIPKASHKEQEAFSMAQKEILEKAGISSTTLRTRNRKAAKDHYDRCTKAGAKMMWTIGMSL